MAVFFLTMRCDFGLKPFTASLTMQGLEAIRLGREASSLRLYSMEGIGRFKSLTNNYYIKIESLILIMTTFEKEHR